MTIGDALAIGFICAAICAYRWLNLHYGQADK